MKDANDRLLLSCLWDPSFVCNLRCSHCFNRCGPDAPSGTCPAVAPRYLDKMSELGISTVMLSGGEPFLRKNLPELVAHGAGLGLKMGVITNGTVCQHDILARLKPHLTVLSISLDAADRATNDVLRDVGSFDGAIRASQVAAKLDIPFFLYMTVQRRNLPGMRALYELAVKIGASGVYYKGIFANSDESYSIQDLAGQLRWLAPPPVDEIDKRCMAYRRSLYVGPDGVMYPCQMTTSEPARFGFGPLLDLDPARFRLRLFGGGIISSETTCPFHVYTYSEREPRVLLCSSPSRRCPFLSQSGSVTE